MKRKIFEKQRTLKKFVQHNFDWDVAGLDAYIEEQSPEIFPELVERSPTLGYVTTMENVKGKEKIKMISTDATLQVAAACGFNASGGVILTDETIEVERIKIEEEYCNEDLVGTWAQLVLAAGAHNQDTEMPFQDVLMSLYMQKVARRTEVLIWQGDTDSVNPNLLPIDGYIKVIDAAVGVVEANTTGVTAITSANGMDVLRTVADAIPIKVLDEGNVRIFCPIEVYRDALNQLYDQNKYHYFLNEDVSRSFKIPGKGVEVVHVEGLDGTNKIYAMPLNLTFFGTDRSGDMSDFRIWYSEDDDKIKVSIKWRVGVQIIYPEYFVKFTLTAS